MQTRELRISIFSNVLLSNSLRLITFYIILLAAQQLCTLPAVPGECYNYTERWYFNSLENQCRLFYYGGCGGNENNFRTEFECRHRCVSSSERFPQPLTPPTPPKPCKYFYKICNIEKKCLPIFMGSVFFCLLIATVVPQITPVLTQADVCRQPADPGPCDQQVSCKNSY